jgi:hypothetical protein
MSNEQAWNHLLGLLNSWANAREVAGGIEVSFVAPSGARRTVEIVMTPEDWEELAEVIGHESAASLRERLLALEEGKSFLICDGGVELLASSTRELPSDDFKPNSSGEWVVTDDAGNVMSRFADWDNTED